VEFADSTGRKSWRRNNGADTFVRTWDATITANRVYTLPDASTSIPIITQTITVSGPTAARTITVPDANFTAARTDAANSFTGIQTILGTSTQTFGATAQASIGVSADTTAGVLTFTPPSSGYANVTKQLAVNNSSLFYRLTNGGSNVTQLIAVAATTGTGRWGIDANEGGSDIGFNFNVLNTASNIVRTVAVVGTSVATAGSETGTLTFQTKPAGGSVATALTLSPTQNATFAGDIQLGASSSHITGNAGNMLITAGTGNSRTLALQSTTSGGAATTFLTGNADQSVSFTDNAKIDTVGKTVLIKSGSNAKAGTFTLSSGAATVTNTSITANSVVCCTVKTSSGTLGTGTPEIVITAGTGFTATGVATDNSTYNFVVLEVN
jgi:hypothetical protein